MHTPLSDAALAEWPEFVARVRARLEVGKIAYGDSSFERPLAQIIEEMRQEALDVCGWGFIFYARLALLEAMMLEATTAHRPTQDAPRSECAVSPI